MKIVKIIEEGSARIYVKPEWIKHISSENEVFYNPAMKVNRDISVAFLQAYGEILGRKVDVLDAMGASGVRAIRYVKETSVVRRLVMTDINHNSVEWAKKNMKLNEVEFEVLERDNRVEMLESKYDFIDLDPFGSPIGFVENAVLSLKHKGILAVTATDISALSGSKKTAALRKYFTRGIKTDFYLEFGIRALAKYVILEGAKHEFVMKPVFAYYHNHHYRIFFQKIKKKSLVWKYLDEIKYIQYDPSTYARSLYDLGSEIRYKNGKILGPIYVGSLYDEIFLDRLEKEVSERFSGSLAEKIVKRIVEGDARANLWHYFDLRYVSKYLRLSRTPSIDSVVQRLNGFRTHFSPTGIKVDREKLEREDLF